MDDKMIPAQGLQHLGHQVGDFGGLYIAELQKVAAAVTVLVNWVNKDKADNVWADLEDRIDCLETQQHELSSNVEEVLNARPSNWPMLRSDLDRAINCIRDAAAELASI
jgi:CII-binding regulator of phage lambda lysogenization HflD